MVPVATSHPSSDLTIQAVDLSQSMAWKSDRPADTDATPEGLSTRSVSVPSVDKALGQGFLHSAPISHCLCCFLLFVCFSPHHSVRSRIYPWSPNIWGRCVAPIIVWFHKTPSEGAV